MKTKLFLILLLSSISFNIFSEPDIFQSTVIGKWVYDIEAIFNSEAGQHKLAENPNARKEIEQMFSNCIVEFTESEMLSTFDYGEVSETYSTGFSIISIDGNEIVMQGLYENGSPNGPIIKLIVLDKDHIMMQTEDSDNEMYMVRYVEQQIH